MDNLTVRTGRPGDVHGVMRLALAACADNGLTDPSPVKLLKEIWPSLNLDHGIMGIVEEEEIRAAALIRMDSLWYSEEKTLIERAIFVEPAYRAAKGGRARLLCEWAKNLSKSLDLPLVIGVLSNERTEAKNRLYARQFGAPAGTYYIFNGHTGLPDMKAAE